MRTGRPALFCPFISVATCCALFCFCLFLCLSPSTLLSSSLRLYRHDSNTRPALCRLSLRGSRIKSIKSNTAVSVSNKEGTPSSSPAKEIRFSPLSKCSFVSRITQKPLNCFHETCWKGGTWAKNKLIKLRHRSGQRDFSFTFFYAPVSVTASGQRHYVFRLSVRLYQACEHNI